jgi:hypothetical protein
LRYASLYILLLLWSTALIAQRGNNGGGAMPFGINNMNTSTAKDTTNKKHDHQDFNVNIYYTTFANKNKQAIQYRIDTLHFKPVLQYTDQDLGNTGSAIYHLQFMPTQAATRSLGQNVFEPYLNKVDNIPFFNTTKPYTDFQFFAGRRQEQGGRFMQTRNKDSVINFYFNFYKRGSPGFYQYQRNKHDQFELSFNFKPTRKSRWSSAIAFALNQIQQDENGGLQAISDLDSLYFFDRYSIPVLYSNANFDGGKISNVRSYYRNNELKMVNQINLASRDSNRKSILPNLVYILHINDELQRYKDNVPLKSYYPLFYSDTTLKASDSLMAVNKLLTIQNEFGGSLPQIAKGKINFEAYFGLEYQQYGTLRQTNNYANNYLRASLYNVGKQSWQYNAQAQLYLLGNNAGSYLWQAAASKKIKVWQIALAAKQSLQEAPFQYRSFTTNFFTIERQFAKQSVTFLSGKAVIVNKDTNKLRPKFSAEVYSNAVLNNFYFTADSGALQNTNLINVPGMKLETAHYFKGFCVYGQTTLQRIGDSMKINAPAVIARLGLSYSNKLYKKLSFCLGTDATYNTSYTMPEYLPLLQQYGYSELNQQNNLPQWNVFLNANIKRVNAYFSAYEMQQPINFVNRVLVNNYAAQSLYFRAGFSWVLIN